MGKRKSELAKETLRLRFKMIVEDEDSRIFDDAEYGFENNGESRSAIEDKDDIMHIAYYKVTDHDVCMLLAIHSGFDDSTIMMDTLECFVFKYIENKKYKISKEVLEAMLRYNVNLKYIQKEDVDSETYNRILTHKLSKM